MSKRVLCLVLLGLVSLFTSSWAAAQSPPTIVKSFSAANVPINGSTTLSFTISNPNPATDLTGVSFNDNIPSGLIVADPDSLNGSCDISFVSLGVSTVTLTNYTLLANSSCTFSVDVLATSGGDKVNTTDPITSTEGGTGGTATATVTVDLPAPDVSKTFGAASIPLHGTTSLSFTISNNADATGTGIGFTDSLPAGLVVASPNGLTGSCPAGAISATAGGTSITLSGAVLDPGVNCTFSVNVTGNSAGTMNNAVSTISSSETGPIPATASASLVVVAAPTIAKSFGAASIPSGGTTSLSFTITNPNASTSSSGIAFTDAFPAGLVIATPNGLTGSCGGGTITATAGSGSVSLSGATLAASGSCVFAVNVTSTTVGTMNNTTGTVTSLEGGTGNTASASLGVAMPAPPGIAKAFGAASIPVNAITSLTFTLANPNSTSSLTGVSFVDSLPAGLVVATPNGIAGSCSGTITATAGSTSVSLAGGTLAPSATCSFTVNVMGTSAGTKNNTTGAISSTESGAGLTASASLLIVAAPSISAAFVPPTATIDTPFTLTFTLTNSNAAATLTGVAFSDTLPAGLVIASPNALSNTCGGTATAASGSGTISLSGGSINGATTCTLSVSVVAGNEGAYSTTTSTVTAINGGTGNAATASVTVFATPHVTPTLSLWNLLLLALVVVVFGLRARRH